MEFINDGKIESITGIYTENTDGITPKYILKPKKSFTHKDIMQIARLYCRMITGEQFEVMRGNMTFDLETIPLKNVPLGGLFIYEVICEDEIIYQLYKKVSLWDSKFVWSTRSGEVFKGHWSLISCYAPVAYTGIIIGE